MGILDNIEEYKAVEGMIKKAVDDGNTTLTKAIDTLTKSISDQSLTNKLTFMDQKDCKYSHLRIHGIMAVCMFLSLYAAGVKTTISILQYVKTII